MSVQSFPAHAASIAGDLSELTRALLQEIHTETHLLARNTAEAVTPVGGAGDKHAGLMKRSWQDVPGSIQSAIEVLQPTKVRNVAPHGLIIDRGRRLGQNAYATRAGAGTVMVPTSRRRKDGSVVMRKRKAFRVAKPRMLGSTQAPFGVKGQVLRAVEAQQDAIFQRAAAMAEAKVAR